MITGVEVKEIILAAAVTLCNSGPRSRGSSARWRFGRPHSTGRRSGRGCPISTKFHSKKILVSSYLFVQGAPSCDDQGKIYHPVFYLKFDRAFSFHGEDDDEREIIQKVQKGTMTVNLVNEEGVSAPLRALIKKLLLKDSSKRLGTVIEDVTDVKNHPYFANMDLANQPDSCSWNLRIDTTRCSFGWNHPLIEILWWPRKSLRKYSTADLSSRNVMNAVSLLENFQGISRSLAAAYYGRFR